MPLATCLGVVAIGMVLGMIFGARGRFHSPLVGFLTIWTSYLVKMAMQLSSQSCPMEIREPDWRSSNMCASWAREDNWEASCKVARLVGRMVWPLATDTIGPDDVGMMFRQYGSALVSR